MTNQQTDLQNWKEEPLEEVLDYEQPVKYIINSKILNEGKTPVLTPGKSFIKGYTNEENGICNNLPIILFDDFTTRTKFVNFPFKVKSSALKILRPKTNLANLKFIYYQMQTKKINFTTHKRYYISNYAKLPFIFPTKEDGSLDIETQQLIVSAIEQKFSKIDNAIKNLKSAKTKIQLYRKAVLKKAFEGKLVENFSYDMNELIKEIENFNNAKKNQDKVRRLPKIIYSDLKNIPKKWFYYEIHKVCNSVRDGTHDSPKYVKEGIPFVTSKNLKNGKIDFTKINFISKKDFDEINKRSGVDTRDILFAMIGTLGNPVEIVEEPFFAIKNVGLFKNKDEKFVLTKYLKYWLQSPNYWRILEEKKLIKGTTQRFIDLGTLRVSPIPICFKQEQQKIVADIESKFSVIDKVEETVNNSLEKAEKLKKSILKSAFEGRLINE